MKSICRNARLLAEVGKDAGDPTHVVALRQVLDRPVGIRRTSGEMFVGVLVVVQRDDQLADVVGAT